MREIERKTRTALTTYKMRRPTADIKKIYTKRKEGRGAVQIETT